jgi:hypothetical protein
LFQVGCGVKLESLVGLDASFKAAQSYEFLIGQLVEIIGGNKVEIGIGTEYEYKLTKELKKVEGDIGAECIKDYKLTAGDGLCIVGGTKDVKSPNKSLISAYADGMIFSFGLEDGTKSAASEYGKGFTTFTVIMTALAVGAAIVSKLFDHAGEMQANDKMKFGSHGSATLSALLTVSQAIVSMVYGAIHKDSVEPSYHSEPISYLE